VGYGSLKRLNIFKQLHQLIQQQRQTITLLCLHEEIATWLYPSLIQHWIVVPHFQSTTPYESVSAIQKYLSEYFPHHKEQPNAILTFDEDCVVLTNFLSFHYHLPTTCSTMEQIMNVKDKYKLRQYCQQWNEQHSPVESIPVPFFTQTQSTSRETQQQFKMHPHLRNNPNRKFIMKPRVGAGKCFISKINSLTEWDLIFSTATSSMKKNLFIEEYFDGNEIDVDLILQHGEIKFLSISDNNCPLNDTFMQETGSCIPSRLPLDIQYRTLEIVKHLIKCFDLQNGCLHLEAKCSKELTMPIEINMRLGGAETCVMVQQCYRINLIELILNVALQIPITGNSCDDIGDMIVRPFDQYLASINFHSLENGLVKSIDVDKSLYQEKRMKELVIFKQGGDTITVPPMGFDSCYGWLVVSSNESQDDAENYLEILAPKIRLHLENL
ncbi:unnamed protein product, partial [Didymodactylos carnosus]